MRRLAGFLSIVVAAGMGLLPVLPEEHVHDVTTDAGHHRQVTHRHLEPHQPGQHHAGTILDHLDPETVHEMVYNAPARAAIGAPVLVASPAVAPRSVQLIAVVRNIPTVPIHGPPRAPCLLRAPPALPA